MGQAKLGKFGRLASFLSCGTLERMGFAVWIDREGLTAWAQGTHEYRPMGTAVVAVTDHFRNRDFRNDRRAPAHLDRAFVGFFGSLETVNEFLHNGAPRRFRQTPAQLR